MSRRKRKKNRIHQLRNPIKAAEKLIKLSKLTETNSLIDKNLEKIIQYSISPQQERKKTNCYKFFKLGIYGDCRKDI